MSSEKRQKVVEEAYNPTLSEIISGSDDYVCRFNMPPPGQEASWRVIDEDNDAEMDESSEEEESDAHREEHYYEIALNHYDELLAKDTTNSNLIRRREELLKMRQEEMERNSQK